MSSFVDSLDVSSSLSGNICFSVLGGIVDWASGTKRSICNSTLYWLAFSPSVRGIKMLVYFDLASRGIG